MPLQGVKDTPTDQNFRQLAGRFPLKGQDIGTGVVTSTHILDGTVADTDLASPNNSVYKTLLATIGTPFGPAAYGASTIWWLGNSGGAQQSGTNIAVGLPFAYLDAANDLPVAGKATKWRVRAQLYTNATAPTISPVVGLYPLSSVAGAAGGITFTAGTVQSGSTITFPTPALSTRNEGNSGDFTAPAAGHYGLAVVPGGTSVASSWFVITAQLQVRNT